MLAKIRIGSDGTQITNASHTYDTAGRMLTSKDALGNTTTYSETVTNYQMVKTTTHPDGGTRVETYYRDGQLQKVTGTAVQPVRYEYGVAQDGGIWREYTKEIKLDGNGNDTAEWTKAYKDMVGRSYKTVYADGSSRQSFYNVKGQKVKEIDPDGVTTLFQYNARGEVEYTALDMNRDGIIDFAGTDRITRSIKSVETLSGLNRIVTRTWQWATNSSAVSNLVSVSEISTDGLRSWNSRFGITNQMRTYYAGNGNRYVTNTAPDASYTVSHYLHGQLQSVTRKDSLNNQLSSVSYAYDAHVRKKASTDARNGTTSFAYDNGDRLVSVTTPPPGTGQDRQTTYHVYDSGGRVIQTILPDRALGSSLKIQNFCCIFFA